MHDLILLPKAKTDIQKAALWYEDQEPGLGIQFLGQFYERVQFIIENPSAAPFRTSDTRALYLQRFPFLIHYFIDEDHNRIVISAVLHTRRNPDDWP